MQLYCTRHLLSLRYLLAAKSDAGTFYNSSLAPPLVAVTAALPFLAAAKTSVDVDVAAVLAYVGAAHRDDGPAQDAVQRVWNDAAWGLLTAIRFQDANPAPVTDGTPGSPVSPSITAQA